MKAIILAAGRGSRMKSLTYERPKCLVELRGKPLLERQLTALREAGIEDIGIVTGYKREALTSYDLVEFYNPRWDETNMVSSLVCAHEWLQEEACIVSYSDIFYESSGVALLMECNADIAITYDPNWLDLWKGRFEDPLSDAETFKLNKNGSLNEIGQEPKSINEIKGQYMGLLQFNPAGWDELCRIRAMLDKTEQDGLHMTWLLQKIVKENRTPIIAIPYMKEWGEVDSEDDLFFYREKF
jgi:choline kinase